jgi:hypothetical protein
MDKNGGLFLIQKTKDPESVFISKYKTLQTKAVGTSQEDLAQIYQDFLILIYPKTQQQLLLLIHSA